MELQYSLHLSPKPIRFDPVSQLTNVFFDDSTQQVFSVRSGGATGITVKGLNANDPKPFRMDDKGKIHSIKFSPSNQILAVQRNQSSVEFISIVNGELQANDPIVYTGKSLPIFGFVWIHAKEVAVFSSGGIDLLQVVLEKRTLKHVKSLNLTINKFEWCPAANFALLHSNKGTILTPVIIRQGSISKLPKLELRAEKKLNLEDITLSVLYGTGAILLLQPTAATRLVEVVIYLLNGPGMAPRMSHVLRLGHGGRFAMNVVDDVIVVHHQDTKTSLLFDIALRGDADPIDNVTRHSPLTAGRPMRPFQLKLPSISSESMLECELYSKSWVVFTPNIVIDADVGCLWTVEINYEALCAMVSDRIRLTEFLLQRTRGKPYLIQVMQELMMHGEYKATDLPIIEAVFDRVNAVYKTSTLGTAELQRAGQQTGTPSAAAKCKANFQARVVVDQADVHWQVLQKISDQEHFAKVMMIYLCSLTKHGIAAQNDLSKMIVSALVNEKRFEILRELFAFSLIHESKPLAISLLQLSSLHPIINQLVMDMLAKMNEKDIIVEVLLEQGKVMDALKIARPLPNFDQLPARKYLEAAYLTSDAMVFHSVFTLFQQRNQRLRGYKEFTRNDQCEKYTEHYETLFSGGGGGGGS